MSNPSSSERIPVIHIGLPKTATKTLQWRLFACHSEIFYLGRFEGHFFEGKYRQFDKCRDQSVQKIMKQIVYDDIENPDFSQCREVLAGIIEPAIKKNLLPVWSFEGYSSGSFEQRETRARNLKEVFDEARIVMTLRNPVSLLESTYFHQLRRDNVGANGSRGRGPYSPSIVDWLKKEITRGLRPLLEYAETLQTYVDLFGLENVSVFLFEELANDSQAFAKNICGVLDIDAGEGACLMAAKADNSRWTEVQLDALKRIKGSFLGSLKFRFSDKRSRRQMLSLSRQNTPLVSGPKAKASIPPEWQKQIFDATEQGNRWIEEMFNLPLSRYGYFGARG